MMCSKLTIQFESLIHWIFGNVLSVKWEQGSKEQSSVFKAVIECSPSSLVCYGHTLETVRHSTGKENPKNYELFLSQPVCLGLNLRILNFQYSTSSHRELQLWKTGWPWKDTNALTATASWSTIIYFPRDVFNKSILDLNTLSRPSSILSYEQLQFECDIRSCCSVI